MNIENLKWVSRRHLGVAVVVHAATWTAGTGVQLHTVRRVKAVQRFLGEWPIGLLLAILPDAL